MADSLEVLTINKEVFASYAFWGGILVLKMVFMSLLTGFHRFRKRVFANVEDIKVLSRAQIKFDDEDVERPRRAHLNDLENVLPFLIIGFMFVLTKPDLMLATWLFRIAAISRLLHTFVYAVVVIPQPARGLAFWGTLSVTIFMAIMVIVHFS